MVQLPRDRKRVMVVDLDKIDGTSVVLYQVKTNHMNLRTRIAMGKMEPFPPVPGTSMNLICNPYEEGASFRLIKTSEVVRVSPGEDSDTFIVDTLNSVYKVKKRNGPVSLSGIV